VLIYRLDRLFWPGPLFWTGSWARVCIQTTDYFWPWAYFLFFYLPKCMKNRFYYFSGRLCTQAHFPLGKCVVIGAYFFLLPMKFIFESYSVTGTGLEGNVYSLCMA